ncbi:CBS domain-containing protein [Siphonobacter aquaeclarae]|jgi:acetoin utilization protein AcuB|uniref:CBS domain-containing protein n=1 Tax=Siphonobacter aquaeclarae TaxID=563176 RepID=A0A1G9XQF7_9BACT|nr:CBS domain-containing protein [Siphonobacter aquaeclarae]MBO9640032.1 CBS domain-containing protein [Siphonobacter aquaeclarae]SDM99052.1 CBS domain-containing protein [Siphonobacter aquaeclarae]
MLAEDLIDPLLPTLRPTDTVGKALDWMQEFRIPQLVLADGEHYAGLLSEERLMNADEDVALSEIQPEHAEVSVQPYQHLFDLLRTSQVYQLEVLPVVDEEQHFSGSISVNDLLRKFSEDMGTQEEGAVIVLKMEDRDYSMAEVSRLVESNDVKIISSYFKSGDYDSGEPGKLTLKLNRRDIRTVVATFERYSYNIDSVFTTEPLDNTDRERLEMLLKYLNI